MKRSLRRTLARLLAGRRYEMVRARPGLIDFLRARAIDEVIDVGANTGQFAAMLRAAGYRGRITSLEPVAAVFAELQRRAAADPDWRTLNLAAGAREESLEIGVAESSVFSSINPTTEAAAAFDRKSRRLATETIAVKPLDQLCAGLAGNILLKIDTQGYEPRVLDGAAALLARVQGVLMELPCIHLYENSWTLAEAVGRMESLGFRLYQVEPVNFSKTEPAALVEIDCLFARPSQLAVKSSE
jgi:FkbM family methyltransferase